MERQTLTALQKQERIEEQRDKCGTTFVCGHERTVNNAVFEIRRDRVRAAIKCHACEIARNKKKRGAAAPSTTHFKRCGHERTLDNIFHKGGYDRCRTCKLAASKRWRDRGDGRYRPYPSGRYKPSSKAKVAAEAPIGEAWKLRGYCRTAPTSEIKDAWFQSKQTLTTKLQTAAARQVCGICPVRKLCLAAGLGEHFGVWGGTTEGEREAFRAGKITYEELGRLAA